MKRFCWESSRRREDSRAAANATFSLSCAAHGAVVIYGISLTIECKYFKISQNDVFHLDAASPPYVVISGKAVTAGWSELRQRTKRRQQSRRRRSGNGRGRLLRLVHLAADQARSTIEASASLRYAGLFLDGFTETGSPANLTVDDREVHLAVARAVLSAPLLER